MKYAKQAIITTFIAATVLMAFVAPVLAVFKQRFEIRQSHGVSAAGTVSFTLNGIVIGGPYDVHCPGPYGDYSVYEFYMPTEPNDTSWDILINWGDGTPVERWNEANKPWPATYTKTHSPSFVQLAVPSVGGIAIPIDKFGLLAPYIGLTSTILVATVATVIYVKRVKRRKDKQ